MFSWVYRNSGLLSGIWFLVIFILCATPGQYIPSSNWLELLSVDKFVHATIFFTLTALFFLTALKFHKSDLILAVLLLTAILYGASLELMQATIFTNRSADWQDIVANTFGCFLTLFFLKKMRKAVEINR